MGGQSRHAVKRIALARLISIGGSAAAYTALIDFVFSDSDGSTRLVALALFLTYGVTGLAYPIGGMLADRFDRKRVMIASDLLGALAFLGMALAGDWLAGVLVFACLSALAEVPFPSASLAAVPSIAPAGYQDRANALLNASRNLGVTIGPIVGGALAVSVGARWVFVANAVSFAISAALVATVRAPFKEEEQEAETHGIRVGFAFLLRDRVLRSVTIAWVLIMIGMGTQLVADRPLVEGLGGGGFAYGILVSVWGLGAVLGSAVGKWMHAGNEAWFLVWGAALIAASSLAVGLATLLWLAIFLIGINGIGDSSATIAEEGLFQRRTPDAIRGRVISVSDGIIQIAWAASFVLGAPLVAWLGPDGVYFAGGILAAVAAIALVPALRILRAEGGGAARGS